MAGGQARLAVDRTMLRAGERVCVAISGGADSTALLLALAEANREREPLGIVLLAVHVHHGLRGADADADQAFVVELCERLGVRLRVFRVDTAARQQSAGEGVEEAARALRYAAFRELMAEGGVDTVATAHTLDDQAETVVMKLLRGAWTEGMGGISPEVHAGKPGGAGALGGTGGRIVRPVLGVRRAEVEAFLRDRAQSWREDATNADVSLIRNRVRHELMPMLRSFNPGVDGLLGRLSTVAREEEGFWAAEVARVLPGLLLPGKPVRGGGRAVSTAVGEEAWSVELERLRGLPAPLRRRVVRAAVRKLGCRMSSEETAKVLALAGFGGYPGVQGKIGSRLELPGGVRVERSARELRLWRKA